VDAYLEGAALLDGEVPRRESSDGVADVVPVGLGEEADVAEVDAEQGH